MLSLKDHPFAVEAGFDISLVLTYAVPVDEIRSMIPQCLQPETTGDKWGFIALAMVATRNLRPKGFPGWLGNDFFLVGYRIFVDYKTSMGKRLRGLYIIRSETDSRRMTFFGNLFTHYKYTTSSVSLSRKAEMGGTETGKVETRNGDLTVEYRTFENVSDWKMPEGSPFSDWKEARRFAGPLPFTFTVNEGEGSTLIIEGVRKEWQPEPVMVLNHNSEFLNAFGFSEMVLANAFVTKNISYCWKKGRKDIWK